MARIAGVNLPRRKRIEYALPYIYGIGLSLSQRILSETKVDGNVRTDDLTEEQVQRLRDVIEKRYKVEGDLRRELMLNLKRLKEIGSYRGMRHARRLPVRGQSTRTNTRTVRGNVRRTMGSGRRLSAQKT